MGVVADFVDAIEDFVEDLFEDGIKANFNTTSDFLTNTLNTSNNDDSMAKIFLATNPSDFTGTSSGGTTIWSTIETLSNNVIVPIGGFILSSVLIYELIQMIVSGNNFKDFDTSVFYRWIIKSFIGILLISNVYYIATGIFVFGTSASAEGLNQLFGTGSTMESLSLQSSALNGYGLGTLITVWLISLIMIVGVVILYVAIIVVMASRMIEIFMYLGISPIPMATMMNNEWGQIGKHWIRGMLALAFQGFFILIALAIFQVLFGNAITSINDGNDDIIMQMGLLLGYTIALIFTVMRSGSISKSIFNAN